MAEIGSWNEHTFEVSPSVVRSFTDLTVKGSSETEDMEGSGEAFVKWKKEKPRTVTMTVVLMHTLGIENVREEAIALVDEASKGATDYFYMGDGKLIEHMLMLTDATVGKVSIAPNGTWVSCECKLTFTQASKADGTTRVSSGRHRSGSGTHTHVYTSGGKCKICGAIMLKKTDSDNNNTTKKNTTKTADNQIDNSKKTDSKKTDSKKTDSKKTGNKKATTAAEQKKVVTTAAKTVVSAAKTTGKAVTSIAKAASSWVSHAAKIVTGKK